MMVGEEINRFCEICKEYVGETVHGVQLRDERNSATFTGHQVCIDNIYKIVKEECVKLNLKQTLAKLNLEVK